MSGYDENLLKSAPEASRAERQEGYNLDLLAPERTTSPAVAASVPARAPSVPPPSQTPPSFPTGPGDADYTGAGAGGKEYSSVSQEEDHRAGGAPVSFWRSGKGKLTIALIALIIVAAIVGGAVGGSVGHSSKSKTKTVNPSSVAPISSASQSSVSSTSSYGVASASRTLSSATSTNTAGASGPTGSTSSSSQSVGTGGIGGALGPSSTSSPASIQTQAQQPKLAVGGAEAGVASDKRGLRRNAPAAAAYEKD